jgi:hypothetical protein
MAWAYFGRDFLIERARVSSLSSPGAFAVITREGG